MAKVFLDANVFIDVIEERKIIDRRKLIIHTLYISPLSIHILTYLYKYSIPDDRLVNIDKFFKLVPFNQELTVKALSGPTTDFEDNVQLTSALIADCDFFLTSDRKILDLKFFGKVRISPALNT